MVNTLPSDVIAIVDDQESSPGAGPGFLKLHDRAQKPRKSGLNHVLDKGCPLGTARDLLRQMAAFIDIWKFGWGSAYLDRTIREKVAALKSANVKSCTGGTLLEIAWLQGRAADMLRFAADVGFDCVEVSDGATDMPLSEKRSLISRARERGFEVLSEIGSKDPKKEVHPELWLAEADGDVAAGADWIVAEGRESGTVGLYQSDGQIRRGLVDVLTQSSHAGRIIYESPQRAQQSCLFRLLGPSVNLGNILLEDVMGLEAVRVGLRADSFGVVAGQGR